MFRGPLRGHAFGWSILPLSCGPVPPEQDLGHACVWRGNHVTSWQNVAIVTLFDNLMSRSSRPLLDGSCLTEKVNIT